ncbi:piggyBac transposable element-derived protein 3-like [Amyelois transitella]|uniref:piggyBac transposable element-derived protein 3-like n=1 Tax=Amyelois transitella TaxID=680683 RepID=UPI00298F3F41|nr:piggyBac transposable element-derived protein 3-like [Amyelois transitella]
MAAKQRALRILQNSRSKQILALVPEVNAPSDVSGESEPENEEALLAHVATESSDAPSIDSSFERLNILDSSLEDDRNSSLSLLTNIINTADEQVYDYSLPSISSLPIISPLSNIPSVTPSFILNQISGSPQQSPQNVAPSQQSPQAIASSPHPRRTRAAKALIRPNIVRRPRRVVNKKIALHFQWTKRHFQHRAELEPDVFVSPLPDEKFPLEYFSDFLSDDILEDTCQFTNMHAVQTRKRGFKNLVRAGASGIIYDFFLYAGNDTFEDCNFSEEEEGLGWGAKAVLRLCKTITKKPCVVYFDNFFSSLELMYHLRHEYGIFSLGTFRANRIKSGAEKLKSDKFLKIHGRGAFSQVVCNKTKLSLVKWNDNKCVILGSSYVDAYPTTKIKRYCKVKKQRVEVLYPNIVKHYNAHMGGVDLADMLIALYRTEIKSKKWYLSIFSQLVDICVNNAWLTYRRDNKRRGEKKYKGLKKFRLEIFKSLLKKGKSMKNINVEDLPTAEKIQKPKRSRPADDVRYDKIDHFPQHGAEYGRCAYCKKGFTTVKCLKCELKLCFVKDRKYFFNYHHK